MQFGKIVFLALVGFVLSACSAKEYAKQESVFIVFKTPTFRHADLGFIYVNDEEMKIEIYSSGQAVMSLEVSQSAVCMSMLECMSKHSFNKEVLSENYPNTILDNIFKGKKIFNGTNVVKMGNGFTQNISNLSKYDITYSVLNKQIIFRDTINDVLIKVKRIEG